MHIYTVTTLRIVTDTSTDVQYLDDSRCVGYFKTFEEAEKVLNMNLGDIYEYYYNYAVIEKMTDGLYPRDLDFKCYKFNPKKNGFFSCTRPTALDNTCSFGIG